MDIWFTLFISIIAIAAAVGLSLVLVGYISVMPVALGQGRKWLWGMGVMPVAVVVLPIIVGTALNAINIGGIEAIDLEHFAKILAGPAFGIHLLVLIAFLLKHRENFAKPGKQFAIGIVLMLAAGSLLYGVGPKFAERAVAMAKTQAPNK